jgi:multidrug efflux pump subunit AcrA (membrane-fusion protein)
MPRAPCAALIAVAALTALNLSACNSREDPDPRTALRLVEVAEVRAAGDAEHTYTGVVAARVQSDLGFRVPGKIIARLVDTGQLVRRGQRLMLMDATDYTHAITAQTGDVAAARARWVQAAADEQRYRGLVESGAISQLTYDQAKAAADSAQALLAVAEAQEKIARPLAAKHAPQ